MTAITAGTRTARARRASVARPISPVTLLTVYLVLLMAIPQALQFAPLGGVGQPSTMLALALFVLYLPAWLHPASVLDRHRQPVRLTGVLWLFMTLASYVAANQHTLPALELNGADRGLISAAGWLGILLLAADGIDTMNRLQTLIRRVVFGATAMAALGMTQFFTGLNATKYIVIPGLSSQQPFTDLLGRDSFNRPSATAAHPLEFAAVLAVALPLAVHQARYAPPGRLRRRRWLQVAVIAATLPMTVSRTAILGLVAGGIVVLCTWPKRDRRLAYLVSLGAAVVMEGLVHGLLGTIKGLFLGIGSDSSAQERTGAFTHAAPLIASHPWLGQGFGTFLPQNLFYTDDQYLNSLIQTGVIGLLALIGLFLTAWATARRVRRLTADEQTRHLAQCLAASIAVAAVSFATFDALSYEIFTGLTFLLIGCIGALWRLTSSDVAAGRLAPGVPDDRNSARRAGHPGTAGQQHLLAELLQPGDLALPEPDLGDPAAGARTE
jgi:polysaccharide biosynthesis protein PslJ